MVPDAPDNPSMHLLIPFAAPLSDAGRDALKTLALPHLAALLAGAGDPARDDGDELSLTPPQERARARALGLAGGDGELPWAAWQAARDGLAADRPDHVAWGLLTPAHWHVGTDQVTLADPEDLQLDAAASRAFLDAVHDLFASEGFGLVWGAPLRWYLGHESLAGMPTASLDRVVGRNVDPWLPPSRAARLWRRLQNEVQMRLHGHPLNEAREARGLLPVNSLWLSGCGVRQPARADADPTVDDRLRRPALAEDWAAWQAAWQALDAGPVAALRGHAATLTLCGERGAAQWTLQPPTTWQALAARWRRADPRALLETL
jgi:hypothetical protein